MRHHTPSTSSVPAIAPARLQLNPAIHQLLAQQRLEAGLPAEAPPAVQVAEHVRLERRLVEVAVVVEVARDV